MWDVSKRSLNMQIVLEDGAQLQQRQSNTGILIQNGKVIVNSVFYLQVILITGSSQIT